MYLIDDYMAGYDLLKVLNSEMICMGFSDKYLRSLLSADLRDDAEHHHPEALQASAHADKVARDIGALLSRVKNANSYRKEFEGDTAALATLQRKWLDIVTAKGSDRKWVKSEDVAIAHSLYRRVATYSLAFYLDPNCESCRGSGVTPDRIICKLCKGAGRGVLDGMREYERKLSLDMVAELGGIETAHAGFASSCLRRDFRLNAIVI